MAVGSPGICEKHELPLDERGGCQLCRLSEMPSKPPPTRTGRMFGVLLAALVFGGGALAFAAFSRVEQTAPDRGVQGRGVPSTSTAGIVRGPPQAEGKPSSIPTPPLPTIPMPGRRVEVAPPPAPPPRRPPEPAITEEDARAALAQVRIEMYSTTWCGSCRRAREYLNHNEIAYTEHDIDADEEAKERLSKVNPRTSIPTFQIDEIVQVGFSPENFEYQLNEAVRRRLH